MNFSIGFCIGCLVAWGYFAPLLSLLFFDKKTFLFALLGFGYVSFVSLEPQEATRGFGRFSPTSIDENGVRGKLQYFVSEGKVVARSIPITLKEEFHGSQDIWIKGTLKKGYFQKDPTASFLPIPHTFHFAEIRFHIKEWIRETIAQNISSKRGAHFLTAMLTGSRGDPRLSEELGRFGLQHLVAISGFHFSAVALLAAIVFKRSLGPLSIVVFLSLYYLLIGPTPAVTRAWGMASLTLIASILGRERDPLHFLGIMLFLILLDDPSACTHIGFQFSFLITGGILVLAKPIEELLITPSPLHSMDNWEKHLYALSLIAKKTLALSLAVHLVGIPYLLCLWGKFPLWSLYFNLFYPFFVSLALFLLLFAISLSWVPLLGKLLFFLLDHYTDTLLSLLYQFPHSFDLDLVLPFSPYLLAIYLPLLPILTEKIKSYKIPAIYGECSSVG